MAILSEASSFSSTRRLGALRLSVTGGLAAPAFYLLCWIGAQIPQIGPATHMYLKLFTAADLASGAALIQGLIWSAAFGLIAGGLVALIYNALAALDRR